MLRPHLNVFKALEVRRSVLRSVLVAPEEAGHAWDIENQRRSSKVVLSPVHTWER